MNCGECLMDKVKIVPLAAGKCPECKADYGLTLSADEKAALRDWRDSNGRRWRTLLADAWMNGRTSGVLQYLRNASYFGPAGLARLKHIDLE